MAKKLFSLLLAAMLCFTLILLTACKDETASESSESGEQQETSESGFLPENKNWGGEVITLLTSDQNEFSRAMIPEELSDEPVSAAFFNRNAFIDEKFGLKLEMSTVSDPNDGVEKVRNDVESAMGEFQIVALPLTYIATLGVEGKLYDITTLDNGYIHYEKEWWDQAAVRDLTINDKMWFLAGDALVEDDEATWAIYFNKDLVTSYNLENPYDIVNDGQWTLDKYYELAKQVHKMNGSSMSYDPSVGDVYGALAQSYDCYLFMLGAGQPMMRTNSDGLPEFRVTDEVNVSTFNKIMDIMLDETYVGVADFKGAWYSGVYSQEVDIFCNGNALFMPGKIAQVSNEKLRDADIRYGILPMPKYDAELQKEYTTSVNVYWCQVLCIPLSNVSKLDATCYALEAMAYYGKEMVTPEYYDRTLTYKRLQDDESRDMLDLIFRNRTYDLAGIFDFGTVNGNGAGSLYFYTSLLGDKSRNITSFWEQKSGLFQSALDELIAVITA